MSLRRSTIRKFGRIEVSVIRNNTGLYEYVIFHGSAQLHEESGFSRESEALDAGEDWLRKEGRI